MFGPGATGGAIDAFESRFTEAAGAHFMIAANGKEAYPISAAESLAFRALYRRRMRRARLIRWASFLAVIPMLMLFSALYDGAPDWARPALKTAPALLLFLLPLFGLLQHPITSDLIKTAIERPLRRRITTRYAPAVTPVATPLGRFAKRLLISAFAIEAAIVVFHAFGGQDALAAHLRVLTGLESGNEGWAARVTGNLGWVAQLSIFAGIVLLMLDRRGKRGAARAKAAEEARTVPAGPDGSPRPRKSATANIP